MINCPNCNASLNENSRFCTECGTPIPEIAIPPVAEEISQVPIVEPLAEVQVIPQVQPTPQVQITPTPIPVPTPQAVPAPQATPVSQPALPSDAPAPGSKYELITAGGYIGIMLLMCIPVIGLLLMIVWACGGCRKLQKRNLARASLIMMAVSLVLSLIIGLAGKKLFQSIMEKTVGTQSESILGDIQEGNNDSEGLLNVLLGDSLNESASSSSESNEGSADLNDLLTALGGMNSDGGSYSSMEDLAELESLLNSLEGLTGEESGYDDLLSEVGNINEEAAKHSDGWPSVLPDYPDGTMNQIENYRTEITGTSLESMMAYIDTLKSKGFYYEDFYDFGMTEDDMLSMNGWWGTNGDWYLSFSYYEGTVTIDHMTELPDLSNLF